MTNATASLGGSRRRSITTAVLMAAMLIAGSPGSAGAAAGAAAGAPTFSGPASGGQCTVVPVLADATGLTSPVSTPAGLRTFRLSSTDPGGTVLGLFRLNQGVALQPFLEHLRVSVAGSGPAQIEAGRIVAAQSTLFGGVNTVPGRPVTFTQLLRPGSYHLVNYADFLADRPVAVRPLTVTHPAVACVPPVPRASIEMLDTPDGPRHRAPDTIRAGAPVLVINRTGQVEEAVIMALQPDVSEADLREFFAALDAHQPPPRWPFASPPLGMPVIGGNLASILEPNLPPGRYALFTWLVDDAGRLRAAQGMHRVLTVLP